MISLLEASIASSAICLRQARVLFLRTPHAFRRHSSCCLMTMVPAGTVALSGVRPLSSAFTLNSAASATLVTSPVVDARDLGFLSDESSTDIAPFDMMLLDGDLNVAVESLEQTMIQRALDACGGNRSEVARRLGIHRQLLYKKLKQFGFE